MISMNEENNIKIREGFLGQRMIVLPKRITSTIVQNPLINSLYITDVGFFPHAKHHYKERKHGSKQFILIYCIKGQGMITIHDINIQLKPNSYYIIPAQTKHEYHAVKKDPWSIYWCHFTGTNSNHIYHKFIQSSMDKALYIPYEERRIGLFENILNVLEDGYRNENIEYVNIVLWQLLNSFLFNEYFSAIEKAKIKGDVIDNSIKFMKSNIERPLQVGEIVSHFNYSSSHFYSMFKKKTGFSPILYFNQLKIQKACQYLSFTDMSVKEISYTLGFSDPLYFSRLFKKLMNVSPQQYRSEYKH